MNVLIIWNEIPDTCFFVIFENVEPLQVEKLKRYHQHYINALSVDGNDKEYEKITEEMTDFFFDEGRFKHTKHEEIIGGKFDIIVITGMIL